ncbi:AP1S3 [Cordylochernes scorpioides]|uniref:AP complex subunit sigma n=1 Tax=Cordylochernes scorpioides TaxID=51811 RepID=A0ABY6KR89_9ARAC|nr:AP1S3 [Cordylochernes scorpioides]
MWFQIQFILLFNRQGSLRLQRWYQANSDKERKRIIRDVTMTVLLRNSKTSSNFVEWRDLTLVYRRYASLYFCCAVEKNDNELITLEIIHRYVEHLDKFFGNVCELDVIFNFEKAYYILDEFVIAGEVVETSKKKIVPAVESQLLIMEVTFLPRQLPSCDLAAWPEQSLFWEFNAIF